MWWVSKSVKFFLIVYLFSLSACKKEENSPAGTIFLASSLASLGPDFSARFKSDVRIDFLSSSAIAKQIRHGAHCDVAIVANDLWRDRLMQDGLVDCEIASLASNRLLLASYEKFPKTSGFVDAVKSIVKMQPIIVGDFDYVPLGMYTRQALVNAQLLDLVLQHGISAYSAYNAKRLLQEHAAPFAILYASDVDNESLFEVASINSQWHDRIHYPVLSCKNADPKKLALIEEFLFSRSLKDSLRQRGFSVDP